MSTNVIGRSEQESWQTLVQAIARLSAARSLDGVIEIVKSAAREISGADGVTFVLRDGEQCHYVDENAISPLWKGQKFPMSACISGWVMMNKRAAIIPDIYVDPRIPHDAYRPTFVKSLVMMPVRIEEPLAAIGAYWSVSRTPDTAEVTRLESLAQATATAISNVSLTTSLRLAAENAIAQAADTQRAYDELRTESARRVKAEEQLRQIQKMEALGQLTGGIAHDFNNLLSIVIGSLDSLLLRLDKEADIEVANQAMNGALRGAELTKQLLAFSRRQQLEPISMDVNGLLKRSSAMLSRMLGEMITVKTVLADSLWPCLADPTQLETAILNFAVNARDAMPDGGTLTIETSNAILDELYAAQNNEVLPGDYVKVSVSDTGVGIPPELMARVLEPFFTTKETGKGTGLGLSMAYGFAKQSGGHLKIYSEVGLGTSISLYLPRQVGSIEIMERAESRGAVPAASNETVLVVDDDASVRRTAARLLKELGYRVLEADSARRALDIVENGTGIDLLLCDIVMPGEMNGFDLARKILATFPHIKILLVTGYADGAARDRSGFNGEVQILTKPYRQRELAERLRMLLDAG